MQVYRRFRKALNDMMEKLKISYVRSDSFIYGYNWDENGIDKTKTLFKLAYDIAKR